MKNNQRNLILIFSSLPKAFFHGQTDQPTDIWDYRSLKSGNEIQTHTEHVSSFNINQLFKKSKYFDYLINYSAPKNWGRVTHTRTLWPSNIDISYLIKGH